MSLYRNKYRIESARLRNWDYSSPGYYFVTVCSFDRICLFGDISDKQMQLNQNGIIVYDEWIKSFEIRHELIQDEFMVMPNHFHTIVRIVGPDNPVMTHGHESVLAHGHEQSVLAHGHEQSVETHGRASLINDAPAQTKISPRTGIAYRTPKSISSLMAGFKSVVTKRINENRQTPRAPVWQPRFHDHIIRDERELFIIRRYIRNNPANWNKDRKVIEAAE